MRVVVAINTRIYGGSSGYKYAYVGKSKPALAARGLSVSYVGRPKGTKSASSAR